MHNGAAPILAALCRKWRFFEEGFLSLKFCGPQSYPTVSFAASGTAEFFIIISDNYTDNKWYLGAVKDCFMSVASKMTYRQ